jgi:hypothetical protein
MKPRKDKPRARALVISLVLSIAIISMAVWLVDSLSTAMLFQKLLLPLGRLIIFICIGLLVGQLIEASGWTEHLAVVAGPLFRFANLGKQCSAAFTVSFFSGVASNAMLLDFYKDDKISRKQLYLTNYINQLAVFFLHLPTTFFMVIPLTRWAGGLYFLLTFLAMVLRTALFVLYGHFMLPKSEQGVASAPATSQDATGRKRSGFWQAVAERLPGRALSVAIYVVPIYTLIFVINSLGWFELTRDWLARYVVTRILPMESLSVVILSFAAEFTSGFAAAGALMDAGVLSVKQTVLALLIGNIIAFPLRALRHQLPRYMGIFSPKMGSQILILGQVFRVASLIVVGMIYYVFF